MRLVKEGKVRKDLLKTLSLNTRNPIALAWTSMPCWRPRRSASGAWRMYSRVTVQTPCLHRSTGCLITPNAECEHFWGGYPQGATRAAVALGQDGHGRSNLTVRVAVQVEQGEVTFDFTGTDPQSAGFMNMSQSAAATFAVLPLMTVFSGEIPCNSGALRCVNIHCLTGLAG